MVLDGDAQQISRYAGVGSEVFAGQRSLLVRAGTETPTGWLLNREQTLADAAGHAAGSLRVARIAPNSDATTTLN